MPEFHDTYGHHDGLTAPKAFGQRLQAPQLPRYVVWSETVGKEHWVLIEATDSFQARRSFAETLAGGKVSVVECCARRVDMIDEQFRSQFPAFSLPVDLPRR